MDHTTLKCCVGKECGSVEGLVAYIDELRRYRSTFASVRDSSLWVTGAILPDLHLNMAV